MELNIEQMAAANRLSDAITREDIGIDEITHEVIWSRARIAALEAERDRLREALRPLLGTLELCEAHTRNGLLGKARAALKET